ncbi:hypothetical protein GCM10023225_32170 [Kineococcus glutinatus]|uniref:MFS transporter n=1 Tax=Kineococcus glutinatus TaxID=1070872 RepID=A0ABP8VA89_9ACTN
MRRGARAAAGRLHRGVLATLTGYARLLRDRRFLPFALMPGLSLAVVVCYVAVSPFVLQEVHGLSPQEFAVVFACNGVALVGGSQLNAALVARVAPVAVLRVAVPLTAVVSAALLAVVLTGAGGLPGLLVVLWLLLAAGGLVPPNAVTLALAEQGRTAGAAAAVVSATQHGLAGLVGIVAAALGGDARALAVVVLAATCASTVLLVLGLRVRRPAVA